MSAHCLAVLNIQNRFGQDNKTIEACIVEVVYRSRNKNQYIEGKRGRLSKKLPRERHHQKGTKLVNGGLCLHFSNNPDDEFS